MADSKIIVIDSIADLHDKEGGVIGKLVIDKAGENHKIKQGQGGKLKKKWDELIIGRAYKLTMGEFTPEGSKKSYPYVADFEEVKNIMEKEAAEKVSKQMLDNRERSMAVSYSKDLLCAGKIEKHELLDWIELFYQAITGRIGGTDEGVMNILRQMIPDEVAQAYKEAEQELAKPTIEIPTEGKIIPQKGMSKAPTQDKPAWVNELQEGIERKHWKFITLKGYLVSHFPGVDFKGVANEVDAMALLTDEQRNIVLKALK